MIESYTTAQVGRARRRHNRALGVSGALLVAAILLAGIFASRPTLAQASRIDANLLLGRWESERADYEFLFIGQAFILRNLTEGEDYQCTITATTLVALWEGETYEAAIETGSGDYPERIVFENGVALTRAADSIGTFTGQTADNGLEQDPHVSIPGDRQGGVLPGTEMADLCSEMPVACSFSNAGEAAFTITHIGIGGIAVQGFATSPVTTTGSPAGITEPLSVGGYFVSSGDYGTAVLAHATGDDGIGLLAQGKAYGGKFESQSVGVFGFGATSERMAADLFNQGAHPSFSGVGVYGGGSTYGVVCSGDHADLLLLGDLALITTEDWGTNRLEIRSNGEVRIQVDRLGDQPDSAFVVTSGDREMLHVSQDGRATVRTLEILGGADVAEGFPIASPSSEAVPGSVLVIDASNPGSLRISDAPYDRGVAGVIAGAGDLAPGVVLQGACASSDTVLVAVSGRIWCLADAGFGSITPGDFLTSSPTPGHAMKVTDFNRARGAILGKAMTGLDSGCGLVLVLVALQ
jgi:hypothetical protein